MAKGIDISEMYEYKIKDDAEGTVFKLGYLSGPLMLKIGNGWAGDITKENLSDVMIDLCRYGVRGWTSFKNKNGQDIPCKIEKMESFGKERNVLSQDSLECLTQNQIIKIGTEIYRNQILSEQDKKN